MNFKKKKILIVNSSLRVGGVRKSLVNLLNNIDYDKCHVDLLLFYPGGVLLDQVHAKVNILESNRFLKLLGMTMNEVIERKNLLNIVIRLFYAVTSRIVNNSYIFKLIFFSVNIVKEYDIAIAYSHNIGKHGLYGGYSQFVVQKINAKKRLGWIHTDYQKLNKNLSWDKLMFQKLDAIINISVTNKIIFDNILPEFRNKSFVIYNSIYSADILNKAKEKISDKLFDNINITGITVARLDKNKAVLRVLSAIKILKDEGYYLNWIVVGDGEESDELKEYCNSNEIKDQVYFTGSLDNPYPYILRSDFLCVSSIMEGMPVVIDEAFCLGVPVIATKYAAVNEKIINMQNGLIVENSHSGVYLGILTLLSDTKLLNYMKEYLKEYGANVKKNDGGFAKFIECDLK